MAGADCEGRRRVIIGRSSKPFVKLIKPVAGPSCGVKRCQRNPDNPVPAIVMESTSGMKESNHDHRSAYPVKNRLNSIRVSLYAIRALIVSVLFIHKDLLTQACLSRVIITLPSLAWAFKHQGFWIGGLATNDQIVMQHKKIADTASMVCQVSRSRDIGIIGLNSNARIKRAWAEYTLSKNRNCRPIAMPVPQTTTRRKE